MDRLLNRTGIIVLLLLAAAAWLFQHGPGAVLRNSWLGFPAPVVEGWTRLERVLSQTLGPQRWAASRHIAESRERILDLEVKLAEAEAALEENGRLRGLLDLTPEAGWRCVFATVIAREPATWNRQFRVDRGLTHGIEPGALALAPHGVVGRVSAATKRSSVVLTVADPSSRLSVLLGRMRAPGVVSGAAWGGVTGMSRCQVTFLPRDLTFQAGDEAVTSGLGDSAPYGLPVGRVARRLGTDAVAEIVNGAYARVAIIPAADIRSLRHVAILCRIPSPAPTVDAD